jgi:dTDP-4-dehydrorhamnose reductase
VSAVGGLWITGATGYLGRTLARLRPDADTTRVEVRDPPALAAHVERTRPAAVIHTAYRTEEWDTNADGAANVARAARGARLVHLSSDVVFSGRKGAPYVEEDEPDPVTEYGRSKAEAELRVAAAHPEALIVRTSLIYGGAEPSKHELAARDPALVFYEDEVRCPVQAGDLAAALLELLALDLSGPLHVAGADAVSRAEFARLAAGRDVRTSPAPPGRPLDCSLDSGRAQGMIRTRLRGVREVLG